MIAPLLLAGVLAAPLEQAVAHLGQTGAAVLVLDARDGAELGASGWIDQPLPPGSLFKLVTALAAGASAAELLLAPRGCPAPGGLEPRCVAGGHGRLALEEALAQSCNAYFAQLGVALGTAPLRSTARRLGLGVGPGRLPDGAAPAGEAGADGAGALVTARQAARLLRLIALGRLPDGAAPPGVEVLPRVRAGLRAAVERGTARGAAAPGEPVAVAGKTGTAAAARGTIGWFAGYAPAASPALIVVVGLRGGRGRDAARAARPLFEAYFHGR